MLDAAVEETRRAVRDLRDLAAGIHPAVLTDHGLAAALEDLTADAALPVRLELDDGRFGADVEAAAYFLVAEGLANVAKHAGAEEATVELRRDNGAAGHLRLRRRARGSGPAARERAARPRGPRRRARRHADRRAAPQVWARRCALRCRYEALSTVEDREHTPVVGAIVAQLELLEDARDVFLERPAG